MPTVIGDRVYFSVAEAAARVVVPFGTMHRWALEGERGISDVVDVRREGKKLYISQSSLKRLVAQEARWAKQVDFVAKAEAEVPALAARAKIYASCFISYSTKDQDFVGRLYSDLQSSGVSCWYAPHHARGGQKLDDQIGRGIDNHDRMLLILSKNSMKSEWVKTEIAKVRRREKTEGRQILFPISLVRFANIRRWRFLDGDTGKDVAAEIREYLIPDFSDWVTPRSYKVALARLLDDLEAVER